MGQRRIKHFLASPSAANGLINKATILLRNHNFYKAIFSFKLHFVYKLCTLCTMRGLVWFGGRATICLCSFSSPVCYRELEHKDEGLPDRRREEDARLCKRNAFLFGPTMRVWKLLPPTKTTMLIEKRYTSSWRVIWFVQVERPTRQIARQIT